MVINDFIIVVIANGWVFQLLSSLPGSLLLRFLSLHVGVVRLLVFACIKSFEQAMAMMVLDSHFVAGDEPASRAFQRTCIHHLTILLLLLAIVSVLSCICLLCRPATFWILLLLVGNRD